MKKRKTETNTARMVPELKPTDFEATYAGVTAEPAEPEAKDMPMGDVAITADGSFGNALIGMRAKQNVTREGWNEPNKSLTFENGVIYCTRDGHKCVWSPNQADIVAMDWKLA